MAYETLPKGFYTQSGLRANFTKAKQLGYSFCFARLGDCYMTTEDGSPYEPSNYFDEDFADNVNEAYQNGLQLFGWYRLGFMPNVHAVDWKTPGNGLQYKTIAGALKNKTYNGIVLDVRRVTNNANTDTNMTEYLKQMIGVLRDMGYGKIPLIISSNQATWSYGGGAVENFIGQANSPYPVCVMNALSKIVTPGMLPSSGNIFWNYGYTNEIAEDSDSFPQMRFIGSKGALLEKFGTPAKWDSIPVIDPPVVDPPVVDPPEDPPVVDPPVIDPGDDDITDAEKNLFWQMWNSIIAIIRMFRNFFGD